MPWTHRTNWSRSPVRPGVGRRMSRTTAAAMSPNARMAACHGLQRALCVAPALTSGSDPFGCPVALGEAVDLAEGADLASPRPDRIGHSLLPAEQAVELALVDPDAGDLALELVGHVGILRRQCNIGRNSEITVRAHLVET